MKRIPPIQTLMAFEAAARHTSFKLAADELYVTPSAISQQIKKLEDALELTLFQRGNRSIELTPAGKLYFATANTIINNYRLGHQNLLEQFHRVKINIHLSTIIWSELIQPNSKAIKGQFPEADIAFLVSDDIKTLDKEGLHFAIRFGDGAWPDTSASFLKSSSIKLACSKQFKKQYPISSIEMLGSSQLLTFSGWQDAWPWLFSELGIRAPNTNNIVSFDSWNSLIQAARDGMGVMMCDSEVINSHVAKHQLVDLLNIDITMPKPFAYYFISQPWASNNSYTQQLLTVFKKLLQG
jgi:DNA-binding transcriptional LysR family regulator